VLLVSLDPLVSEVINFLSRDGEICLLRPDDFFRKIAHAQGCYVLRCTTVVVQGVAPRLAVLTDYAYLLEV
jgi:hypothetical protein